MKCDAKESIKSRLALLGMFFFLLSGCADTKWPTWISGEPGDEVLRAPRVVEKPVGASKKTWPSLGGVPGNKPDFSDPLDMKDEEEALESDRLKGLAAMERLRNVPMPEPIGGFAAETQETKTSGVHADVLPAPAASGEPLLEGALEAPAPAAGKAKPFSALLP